MRGVPAVVAAALVSAALAGGGTAAAAAHTGGAGMVHRAAAGTMSTVAGGIGGPDPATNVAFDPCDVAVANGHLYMSDSNSVAGVPLAPIGAVRVMSVGSSLLTTFAGTRLPGPLGDGGLATRASMEPCSVVVDHSGNLLLSDGLHARVRVVAHRTGTFYGQAMTAGHIYTVAGDGTAGFAGDGGPATKAELAGGVGLAVDAVGNLVLGDGGNQRIRVVAVRGGTFYGQPMTAGDIYTVAGDGTQGFNGDGGPATSAELDNPGPVAVDAAGNLVIADTGNSRVRVVASRSGTFYGQKMTANDIYTVAGDGTGNFANGVPATSTGVIPYGLAVDAAGNLVITDRASFRVRVVAARTGTFYGQKMTANDIYTVAGDGNSQVGGFGGPAIKASLYPLSVTVDAAGNLVIVDHRHLVSVVAEKAGTFYGKRMKVGDFYQVAGNGRPGGYSGDGGPATSAELTHPDSMTVDAAGNLVFTGGYRIRAVAGTSGTFFGQKMTAGNIYTVAGTGHLGFSGDGGLATKAELYLPSSPAVDAAGNLVFADSLNNRIRVVAAHTGTFYGQAMKQGDIYTVAGDGQAGFTGDFGPATAAELQRPEGVAVDAAGNLVISDSFNHRVRVVAARTGTFYGQRMTANDIYTVAGDGGVGFAGDGGPAKFAEIETGDITVDAAGDLVLADSGNQRIRVVAKSTGTFYGQKMTANDIYTVAGDGIAGFLGDGGPATSAWLNSPAGIAVDTAGNLLVADTNNERVRVVAERTGTFYGVAMTAGHIYTIAGNGKHGFSGDGGAATKAELKFPEGVAVNAAGNLVIADYGNGRVRMVTG